MRPRKGKESLSGHPPFRCDIFSSNHVRGPRSIAAANGLRSKLESSSVKNTRNPRVLGMATIDKLLWCDELPVLHHRLRHTTRFRRSSPVLCVRLLSPSRFCAGSCSALSTSVLGTDTAATSYPRSPPVRHNYLDSPSNVRSPAIVLNGTNRLAIAFSCKWNMTLAVRQCSMALFRDSLHVAPICNEG